MSTIYFTITGTSHYYGTEFIKQDMNVTLVKEPDNKYDSEAIEVKLPGMGTIGHVANSPSTVIGESYSAGRLYDKFDNNITGKVLYIFPNGVLCELEMDTASET